jgi:hypothetical protein
MTYGRFREGEIHWTLLSLLVSDGHSKQMFAELDRPDIVRRRRDIVDAIASGTLATARGGLATQATAIERADGSVGPWIDGFDPATIRVQLKLLRNACYVFCAALTMMRDSELLSIKKGALTTSYGAPAVTSQLRKGRRGPSDATGGSSNPLRRQSPSRNDLLSATTSSALFDVNIERRTEQVGSIVTVS